MFFEKLQRLSPFGGTGRGLYFNLYNMNGRMYDPLVGRFLSADPVNSDGGYTQSYNRYSYCLNNPLKFTDPYGYTYKPTYWDEAIGGGGVPVRTYGRFDFAANSVWNNWTGGSNYSYDQNHNRYLDQLGNVVTYQEVNSNYIGPNSSERYAVTQTAYSLDGGKTFIGNGNYSLVELGHGVESIGLYPTFTSRQSGLDFINSVTGRNPAGGGLDKFNNYIGLTGIGMEALSYAAKNSAAYTPKYAYSGMAQAEAAAAKLLGNIAKVTRYAGTTASVLSTTYSGYKVIGQIQAGGLQNINGWDAADTGVGLIGIGASGALYFGLISNPVGWTIGAGVLIYGGARLAYDLYNDNQ